MYGCEDIGCLLFCCVDVWLGWVNWSDEFFVVVYVVVVNDDLLIWIVEGELFFVDVDSSWFKICERVCLLRGGLRVFLVVSEGCLVVCINVIGGMGKFVCYWVGEFEC